MADRHIIQRAMTLTELEKEIQIPEQYLAEYEKYPNIKILFGLTRKGKFEEAIGHYRGSIGAGTFLYTQEELDKTRSKRNNRRLKDTYGGWFVAHRKEIRAQLILKRGSRCEICNEWFSSENLTIDHIKQIKNGGQKTKLANMQLLCFQCHIEKEREHQKIVGNLKYIALSPPPLAHIKR